MGSAQVYTANSDKSAGAALYPHHGWPQETMVKGSLPVGSSACIVVYYMLSVEEDQWPEAHTYADSGIAAMGWPAGQEYRKD